MSTEEQINRLRLRQRMARAKQDVENFVSGPPPGWFPDPRTGAWTNRELLRNNVGTSKGRAFTTGASQGASFGFMDELMGLAGRIEGGPEMAKLRREQARAINEAQQEAHPNMHMTGDIAGSVAAALPAAGVATGSTLLRTAGRGAGIGAAEGALHGAGRGEGLKGRAEEALQAGALGAGLGGIAPPVVAAGAAGLRGAGNFALGALNIGNQSRANRAIMDTLRKAGLTVDDASREVAEAAAQGQPEFRLMDAMGVAGQRRASGITRAGDGGAEEIAQFLRQRQTDQSDRVLSFTDDAFGTSGTTAEKTREGLKAARADAANEAYALARGNAAPVDVRGAVDVIDARIGGMQGSNIAGDSIDGKLAGYRSRLMADPAPDGEISRELSDFDRVLGVKQDVQDAIGAAVRAGRNNEARELGKLAKEIDTALEASSDGYRAANDGFREASRVIDSVDVGAQMANRGRAADNVSTIESMTPEQKQAARVGFGDKIAESIERNRAQAPNAAREFNSSKRIAESDALAIDAPLLRSRIDRENTMHETFQRALGGSRTADNLEDVADTGLIADAARGARDVASGNFGSALAQFGGAAARKATGQNEATRQMIARMLLSDDPKKALAQALKQEGASSSRKRIADALARALGHQYAPL